MPESLPRPYDVIIAGAGPVGLFLAGELLVSGCSVLVLEQAPDAGSPLKRLPFGLRGLSVPTLESLDRRGLLAALRERAAGHGVPAAHWMQQPRAPGGHFAGIPFFRDRVDETKWPYRLPGATGTVAADMENIEAILAERAAAMGADIRRGCGVEDFTQSEDAVSVHAGGRTFAARWLVGCDGGRSTVRKIAGIGFTGTEPEFTGYSAQVELADPDKLRPGRHYTDTGMYTYTPPGTVAMVDFDGGACHRTLPLTRDHIETVLRRISGTDITVTALELAATWTDRAFQALDYRKGRVLLAGDAAHVHSPLGGQGLNLGLGDAMNLGWKLAATIHGAAPPDLLDSYAWERRPEGERILDWSRAQVALMRPSGGSHALAAIVRDLMETDDGATYFAERIWGVGLRYDLGGHHPLVGRSAPDFELADGTRLNERLRSGRGLLLNFVACPLLQSLAEQWSDRIDHVAIGAKDRRDLSAVMVRPDGVVAWASESGADHDGGTPALSRWFGNAVQKKRPLAGQARARA